MPIATQNPGVKNDTGVWHSGSTIDKTSTDHVVGNHVTLGVVNAFFRFPSINIPQGSTIVSAYLTLKAADFHSANTVNWRIRAIDADNTSTNPSYSDVDSATLTTAQVDWSGVPTFSDPSYYSSPDIGTVIDEVIARGGWTANNAITLELLDNASSATAVRDPSLQIADVTLTITFVGEVSKSVSTDISGTLTSTVARVVHYTRSLSDTLTMTSTVGKLNEFYRGMSHAIDVQAAIPMPLGQARTVETVLGVSDSINSSLKGYIHTDDLAVSDTLSRTVTFFRSLTDVVELLSSFGRTFNIDYVDNVNFAQGFSASAYEAVEHFIDLQHVISYTRGTVILHVLGTDQVIGYTLQRPRSVVSVLNLQSYPAYYLINEATLVTYTPFLMGDLTGDLGLLWLTLSSEEWDEFTEAEYDALASTLVVGDGGMSGSGGDGGDGYGGGSTYFGGDIEKNPINHAGGSGGFEIPPPLTAATLVHQSTITLTFPYPEPNLSLTLRNPRLGNTQSNGKTRIQRNSAGGTLLQFRDGIWSKYTKLAYEIEGLSKDDAEFVLEFFYDSVGQEIGLLDYEGRQWRGIVLTPDTEILTKTDDCNYVLSFEFEGEKV